MNRVDLLERLLAAELPPALIAAGLSRFGWDSPPLVVLRRRHVASVLERYLARELAAEVVRDWAELVEVRDDVALEAGGEDVLRDILFGLASPELEGELTPEFGAALLARVNAGP